MKTFIFKVIIKGIVLIISFVGFLSFSLYADTIPEPILICNDGLWPPFGYKDPNNMKRCTGICPDILTEIFSRKGLKFEIKILPWKRCLKFVEEGRFHIVTDASKNPEREKKFFISNPVYTIRHGLYYEKSRFINGSVIKTTQDVNKYKIGGILGYNFGIYKFDTSKIDQGAQNPKVLLTKLRMKRHDFVIGYVEIFESLAEMEKIDLSYLGWTEIPESTPLVFHMMVPRNEIGKEILKIIDKGLKQLRDDGTYKMIFKKYGVSIK